MATSVMPPPTNVEPRLTPEAAHASVTPTGRTLIVIPAHNEQENIGEVLDELEQLGYGHDVVVVDDASRDDTAKTVEKRGKRCLRLSANLGYGGAMQSGFKYALEHGYDYVVQMDGDLQHDPRSIPALLEAVRSGRADVALGSRFLGKVSYQVPALRRAGIALFRTIVSSLIGQKVTDPTSGFQAHNRKVLAFFAGDNYPVDYPDSDVLLALHYAGLRIEEVPVSMRPRIRGTSIHGGWKTVYYLAKMFLAIFVVLLRQLGGRKKRP